jgi:hypothetical protein
MTKDEALRLAFEALEEITRRNQSDHQAEIAEEAITAIKVALEAPQRTWVGLTPEDTFEIGERLGLSDIAWVDLMQAIEAKLKQKNT